MNSKAPPNTGDSSLNIESLLDPSNPYVLTVVLPAAVLGAFGFKRAAIFWVMAVIVWNIVKRIVF